MRTGDDVAPYLKNAPRFVVATHAVWLPGPIAMPINQMFMQNELAFQFQD